MGNYNDFNFILVDSKQKAEKYLVSFIRLWSFNMRCIVYNNIHQDAWGTELNRNFF